LRRSFGEFGKQVLSWAPNHLVENEVRVCKERFAVDRGKLSGVAEGDDERARAQQVGRDSLVRHTAFVDQ
jgi:hypothetical protein